MAYVRPPTWNDGDVVYAADLENVYDGIDSKAPTIHSHASTQITDATVTGRALLTAANADSALTILGAAAAADVTPILVTETAPADTTAVWLKPRPTP